MSYIRTTLNVFCLAGLFLPVNYLLGATFNYLIPSMFLVLVLISANINKKIKVAPIVLFGLLFSFSVLNSFFYGDNVLDIITSPVLLFIFYLMLVASGSLSDVYDQKLVVNMVTLFVILICFYFSFSELSNITVHGRNRGLGSGSITTIIGLLIFCISLDRLVLYGYINSFNIVVLLLGLIIVLIVQARGPILSIAIMLLFAFFKVGNLKQKMLYCLLLLLAIFIVNIVFIYNFPDIYKLLMLRFEFSGDVESYSSGRITTYYFLFDKINESNLSVLFGNGLGSLRNVINANELEFPHNDFLYVFYELGVVGMSLFFVLYYKAVNNLKSFSLKVLVITTMLHTNFILFSYMLIAIYFVDVSESSFYKKNTNYIR